MRIAPAVSLSASNVSPGYLQPITLTADVKGDFDNHTCTAVFKAGGKVWGSKSLMTGITPSP
jgi:hypothetical protein